MLQQGQLFPLRIAYTFKPPSNSADLKEYARTKDGHDWAVKWPEDGQARRRGREGDHAG